MDKFNDPALEISQNDTLPATGERFLPTLMSGDIALEHLHRYAIALGFATNKSVLDIASGEGYGTNLLTNVASYVIGVDISLEAVDYARKKYIRNNLEFRHGSCSKIPVEDHSIDLVVSFETLEHHDQHIEMMAELKRVLKPGGLLIISTPNKLEYTDHPDSKNSYHIKELYLDEFSNLLSDYFNFHKIFGQRIYHGSVIAPLNNESVNISTFSGDANEILQNDGLPAPMYYVALASDLEREYPSLNILDGTSKFTDEYNSAHSKVDKLNNQLSYLNSEVFRIKSTFSWRITKPLRLIANLPRSIRKILYRLDK